MRSTFAGFTTGRLAIMAAQKGLDITGQNIANSNTDGYTRQRLDVNSVSAGVRDKYTTFPGTRIGYGAEVTSLSQIRNPFLDVRFRNEICKSGEASAFENGLKELEGIFDEIKNENYGLGTEMGNFLKSLQNLATNAGNTEFDGIASGAASTLTKLFNHYASKIADIREQEEYSLQDVDITSINDTLKNIAELNKNIRDNEIHGDAALELKDDRNLLIDKLAKYAKINVTYVPVEVAPGFSVDQLKIDLITNEDPPNNKIRIVDDIEAGSFKAEKVPNDITGDPYMSLEVTSTDKVTDPAGQIKNIVQNLVTKDVNGELTNRLQSGALKGSLEFLNENGGFDDPASSIKGIGFYEKSLDTLVSTFANAFNEANKNPNNNIPDDDEVLFASNDGGPITAKNIIVSEKWAKGEIHINTTKTVVDNGVDNSGARENIDYMISLLKNENINFEYTSHKTINGVTNTKTSTMFSGTFQQYYSEMSSVLNLDLSSKRQLSTNYAYDAQSVDDLRQSVSGVNLDEEGTNLMQYQKSLTAASRYLTTIDEALEGILSMGRVGR